MKTIGIILGLLFGGCVLLGIVEAIIVGNSSRNSARSGSGGSVIPAPAVIGPVKPFNVRLSNSYADSIFTLDVTIIGKPIDGGTAPMGKKVRVWDRERVAGHDFVRRDALFTIPRDSDVKVSLTAMSLGENRYFTPTVKADPHSDTLSIDYDWDVATAAFTIHFGWR